MNLCSVDGVKKGDVGNKWDGAGTRKEGTNGNGDAKDDAKINILRENAGRFLGLEE